MSATTLKFWDLTFKEGVTPEGLIDYLNRINPELYVQVTAPGVMLAMEPQTVAAAIQVATMVLREKQVKERTPNVW